MHALLSLDDASTLVRSGAALALAGSPEALAKLPRGRWIGGSTHYFVGAKGGVKSGELVFVTDLSRLGTVTLATYPADRVDRITAEAPEEGFSLVILPAASGALQRFAQHGHTSAALLKPVAGWVSGTDLAAGNSRHAIVVDGRDGSQFEDAAVVAHVTLPAGRLASIEIINPFEPRPAGPVLRFPQLSFFATECLVDGAPARLADFLTAQKHDDGRLPLIGDFSGARINAAIKSVDPTSGLVEFFGPVFPGVDYHLAQPVDDFARAFAARTSQVNGTHVAFGCNCILNYLFGELEGRPPVHPPGPITFGEVGYQLLNQTFVMLTIH